jgi:hypothetical protein
MNITGRIELLSQIGAEWGREKGMKARRLIDGASFGPETLKALGEAFDQAWAEIAGNFGDIPFEIENAKLRLAEAMLSVATEGSMDVAVLRAGALQAMALDYRSGIWPTGIIRA